MISLMISKNMEDVCSLLNDNLEKERCVEKRLNVDKFQQNYVGWVYIYCKKSQTNEHLFYDEDENQYVIRSIDFSVIDPVIKTKKYDAKDAGMVKSAIENFAFMDGHVVVKLWCSKAERVSSSEGGSSYILSVHNIEAIQKDLSDFESAKRFIACANCLWSTNNRESVCYFNKENCSRIAGTKPTITMAPSSFIKVHELDDKCNKSNG